MVGANVPSNAVIPCRPAIVRTYAAWTALSALRSGAPIKSRKDVYPLLATASFDKVLDGSRPVDRAEFDSWHRAEADELCRKEARLNIGWACKIINVYLKTASYIGGLGRPGLASVIHPPIDGGLWMGLERRFADRPDILRKTHKVKLIKNIKSYDTYLQIIEGCRMAAAELGCDVVEVDQLWEGSIMPETP